jgi:hypothetical protein
MELDLFGEKIDMDVVDKKKEPEKPKIVSISLPHDFKPKPYRVVKISPTETWIVHI